MRFADKPLILIGLFCVACSSGGSGDKPAADASAYADGTPLNPKTADGRLIMMGFDTHHPDCFAVTEGSKETEEVECSENAMSLFHECRGGRIYKKKGSDEGCVCVPISGDAPTDMECPRIEP